MGACNYRACVHNGDQRRSRSGHFSGIQGTVRDYAVDRAANFRVTQLRRGSKILALCRLQLAGSGFEFLLLAHGHQRIEMALRKFILIFCLSESDSGLIEVLARERALLVEILTAVDQAAVAL